MRGCGQCTREMTSPPVKGTSVVIGLLIRRFIRGRARRLTRIPACTGDRMHRNRIHIKRTKAAVIVSLAACVAVLGARPHESPFFTECNEAMSTMMRAMHITSHGDADADFATMMIAHHEGAIAMARAEL